MNDFGTRAIHIAEQQLGRGQADAAIDTLVRLLGDDPDNSHAHGMLALCLLKQHRLYAAGLEAQHALEIDPESLLALLATASVAVAKRQFKKAETHLAMARELNPANAAVHDGLSRLYFAWDRDSEALEHNRHACKLAPDDHDYMALRARLELQGGNRDEARRHATWVLELDPEHLEALCVLGHCELRDGNTRAAREHAIWAVQLEPTSKEALTLLSAVKARQSWILGLWWRFQSFVSSGSRTRAIMLLLGMFLLYRVAMIALDEGGHEELLGPLSLAWLAFCAYTWFAPTIFWRSVKRELEEVRLRPDY